MAIHSSRSAQDGGVAAMRQWLWRALLDHTELTPEEATMSIEQLQAFKPWWQKEGG